MVFKQYCSSGRREEATSLMLPQLNGFLCGLVIASEDNKAETQRNRFSNIMKIFIPFYSLGECAGKRIFKG